VRAFVIEGPGRAGVREVPDPVARPGQVLVEVDRVGLCGTDVELFTGEMAYLRQGHAAYPLRPGHEWCGTVSAVGDGVDGSWLGRRVTGDTMLGCGRCPRCRGGRHHVCEQRREIGIRGGWPGALAARLPVPAEALVPLPDPVGPAAGALVEPGGSALRAVQAARLEPGARVLVWGPGTIGLLAAMFAAARGAEIHVVGLTGTSLALARDLGVDGAWTAAGLPELPWDAVIDATNDAAVPRRALEATEPGRRVVYVGLAGAVDHYATGQVDPEPLVAATVGLDQVAGVLAGGRPPGAGPGPKIQVDPRR
jgi:threonine dehydrogenase-like Zn-dependent dehydrogenase